MTNVLEKDKSKNDIYVYWKSYYILDGNQDVECDFDIADYSVYVNVVTHKTIYIGKQYINSFLENHQVLNRFEDLVDNDEYHELLNNYIMCNAEKSKKLVIIRN